MLNIFKQDGIFKVKTTPEGATQFSTLADSQGVARIDKWAIKNGQLVNTSRVIDLKQAGFTLIELGVVIFAGVVCCGVVALIWTAIHFIAKHW